MCSRLSPTICSSGSKQKKAKRGRETMRRVEARGLDSGCCRPRALPPSERRFACRGEGGMARSGAIRPSRCWPRECRARRIDPLVVGLDEGSGSVVPFSRSLDPADWWGKLASQFDGPPPDLTDLVVPTGHGPVVGLLFHTVQGPVRGSEPCCGPAGDLDRSPVRSRGAKPRRYGAHGETTFFDSWFPLSRFRISKSLTRLCGRPRPGRVCQGTHRPSPTGQRI